MQLTYTKNYLKIYTWQGISLILNFISMFIVIPYLTSQAEIYGIYSVCVSFSIFLAYADLGFMASGQKYAAEYFAKGDIEDEIKFIGFTTFILIVFLSIFSLCFFALSQYPEFLVKSINTSEHHNVASKLLLILAVFTPTTLLQRLLQMIFRIRMEDFIIQRSNIIGNILKIISVLWYFRKGSHDIVGYFLFTNIINFCTSLITLYVAKKRYNYNFIHLFRNTRYNKFIFAKTKGLAYTSLILTFFWIIYYELDSVAIGKFLGAKQVAIYAIGLTILSFFRSILGIIFSPFNNRFNHFIGLEDEKGLKSFFLQIIIVFSPIVVYPIVSIALLAEPIVLAWVGNDYSASVSIIQFLIFCNILAFISYPTNALLLAKERQNELILINSLLPFVYWIGILLTIGFWGITAFAIFKLVSFLISSVLLYFLMMNYLDLGFISSLKKIFVPMMIPITFIIASCIFIEDYLPQNKSTINLVLVALTTFIVIAASFLVHFFVSVKFRDQVFKVFKF